MTASRPAANKPLWRRGVEAVDKVAAPVLEGATRHEAFGVGLGLVSKTQKMIFRRTERVSRRALHRLNLPTASDMNRLLTQIAAVENRVRTLSLQLEDRSRAEDSLRAFGSGADGDRE